MLSKLNNFEAGPSSLFGKLLEEGALSALVCQKTGNYIVR